MINTDMKISELLESRRRVIQYMYHGTSSKYLRSILKYGLITDPPQKSSGMEDPKFISFDNAIYLTSSMKYAMKRASDATYYKYNPILVIVKFLTTSGVLDEDTIFRSTIVNVIDHYVFKRVPYNKLLTFGDYVDTLQNSLLMSTLNELKGHGKPTLKSVKLTELLLEQIAKLVENFVINNEYGFDINSLKSEVSSAREILITEIMIVPKIRKLVENLIDTIKVYSVTPDTTPYHSVRVKRNIGYKGSTRIVKIIDLRTKTVYYDSDK